MARITQMLYEPLKTLNKQKKRRTTTDGTDGADGERTKEDWDGTDGGVLSGCVHGESYIY